MSHSEPMTSRERIRSGLLGLPTDRTPLHCRLRMVPLTPECQWIRDLGWGVVGGHPTFAVAPDGDMTLPEAGAAWPGRVISLNFPSKFHHVNEEVIRAATQRYVAEAPQTGGLLISLTEDFPKSCERKLFTTIAEAVQEMS